MRSDTTTELLNFNSTIKNTIDSITELSREACFYFCNEDLLYDTVQVSFDSSGKTDQKRSSKGDEYFGITLPNRLAVDMTKFFYDKVITPSEKSPSSVFLSYLNETIEKPENELFNREKFERFISDLFKTFAKLGSEGDKKKETKSLEYNLKHILPKIMEKYDTAVEAGISLADKIEQPKLNNPSSCLISYTSSRLSGNKERRAALKVTSSGKSQEQGIGF